MFQKFCKSLGSNDLEKISVSMRLMLAEQRLQRSDLAHIIKLLRVPPNEAESYPEEELNDSSGGK